MMPANPYLSLLDYSPAVFVGRANAIRSVLESVDRIGPIALLGLPGIGKSTILRYLADQGAQGAVQVFGRLLPLKYRGEGYRLFLVRVEFRKRPLHMHPFEYLHLCMRQECKEQSEAATLADKLSSCRELTLYENSRTGDSYWWAGQLDAAITMLARNRIRPVLLLDDFDLAYGELSFEETSLMRPWRESAAFILATERRLEDVNPDAMGSPFWSNMMVRRLGCLREEEAEELFAKGRPNQEKTERLQACVDLALEMAGGHPYLVIMAGVGLWELEEKLALDRELPPLRDHLVLLRGRLQADFRRTFHMYRERLDTIERTVVLALARGDQLTGAQENRLATLEDLGLVEKGEANTETESTQGFRLFSPAFRDFLMEFDVPAPSASAALTENERRIYAYMRRRIGEVCSFRDLWAAGSDDMASSPPEDFDSRIHTAVSRMRPKLRALTGDLVVSIRGQGYRLVSPSGGSQPRTNS